MQPVGTPIPDAASSPGRSRAQASDRPLASSLPMLELNKSSSTTSITPLRTPRVKNTAPKLADSVAEYFYNKIFNLQGKAINWVNYDLLFSRTIDEFQNNFAKIVSQDNLNGRFKWMSPEEGCSYFEDKELERKLRVEVVSPLEAPLKKTIWRIGTILFYLHTGSLHPIAKILHAHEQGQIDRKTAYTLWAEEVDKLIADKEIPERNFVGMIWHLLRAKPGARFSFNEVHVNFKPRI